MTLTVFLGLSLDEAEARGIADADFRGPLIQGDLDAIDPPATVVIIDGILDPGQRLEVDEARRALKRGLVLHGASSMGAMLAARLESAGMTGSGQVLDLLRPLGQAERQDLIMALYDSRGFRQLTVPLVNALAYLHRSGVEGAGLAAAVRALRGIPLEARSWESFGRTLCAIGLELLPEARASDPKRDDAIALLRQLVHSGQCRAARLPGR